nr:hypothetical protein [Thiolapillus sp.]
MFSLWRKARRENSAASRLLGSTSLRFALHGWQRAPVAGQARVPLLQLVYCEEKPRPPGIAVGNVLNDTRSHNCILQQAVGNGLGLCDSPVNLCPEKTARYGAQPGGP